MRVQLMSCYAAAVAVLASPAAAREPTVLAPLGPWNLHYSDNSCQLARSFGDKAKPTTLAFESLAPDNGMTMLVFGGALTARLGSGEGKARFVPIPGRSFDGGKITETTKGGQTAIFWSNISVLPDVPAPERDPSDRSRDPARTLETRALETSTAAGVTGLEIVEPRQRVTILQTGPLAKAMQMVRECNREQMTGWGLDPAIQDKIVLAARATRNVATLFKDSDYPRLAVLNGEMSVVTARLIVGADGKVSRCTSLTPFTGDGFKEIVCERLSEAVFEPAELADGSKVPTFVITRVIFRMP